MNFEDVCKFLDQNPLDSKNISFINKMYINHGPPGVISSLVSSKIIGKRNWLKIFEDEAILSNIERNKYTKYNLPHGDYSVDQSYYIMPTPLNSNLRFLDERFNYACYGFLLNIDSALKNGMQVNIDIFPNTQIHNNDYLKSANYDFYWSENYTRYKFVNESGIKVMDNVIWTPVSWGYSILNKSFILNRVAGQKNFFKIFNYVNKPNFETLNQIILIMLYSQNSKMKKFQFIYFDPIENEVFKGREFIEYDSGRNYDLYFTFQFMNNSTVDGSGGFNFSNIQIYNSTYLNTHPLLKETLKTMYPLEI